MQYSIDITTEQSFMFMEFIDAKIWISKNASLCRVFTNRVTYWSSAARKVLVLQPFSAGAERGFSLLKASFSDQQESSLQDYIEASLMLQYNNR